MVARLHVLYSPMTVAELCLWPGWGQQWDSCSLGAQEDPDFPCRFVLLVSGLGLGGGGGESLLGTQLLVDVVTGQLGDEGEQCSAAHVSRVILAGNLLSHNTQSRDSINKVLSPPTRLPTLEPLLPQGESGCKVLHIWWPVPHSDAAVSAPALLSEGGGPRGTEPVPSLSSGPLLRSPLSSRGSECPFNLSLPWGLTACGLLSPGQVLNQEDPGSQRGGGQNAGRDPAAAECERTGCCRGRDWGLCSGRRQVGRGRGGGGLWRALGPASSPAPVPSRRRCLWT